MIDPVQACRKSDVVVKIADARPFTWSDPHKGVGSRALADIIRTVAAGDSYVAPTLSARLISQTGSGARANPFVALTEREREVLELPSAGLSNKHIGLKLDLHEKTIKHHMTQIVTKLGVSNRTEAAMAFRDEIDRRR